jgi:NAD(P)-dependent dehydrogenase (short-subunit alcohol dehydrogenase family)
MLWREERKMKLQGRVALITGGGTGIGASIAERFAAEGAKVCITGRRVEKLKEVLKGLPAGAGVSCAGDVTDPRAVERIVSTVIDWGGRLDILVNNAGITTTGAVADVDLAVWRETIDVNLTGPFFMMRASIPHMIRGGGGAIINIASVAGLRCPPEFAAYSSSKAGLIMLSQQAALDYARFSIRCNIICPGWVRTAMSEHDMDQLAAMIGTDREGAFARVVKGVPQGRVADPREIASVCAFLASEDASYMTGAVLVADGGSVVVDAGMVAFRG